MSLALIYLLSSSLALRKEHGLEEFDNRVLRRIFGPKRDEMLGSLRDLHNEELHNLYYLSDITTIIKPRKKRGIEWSGVDWINLAQDRDQWKALLKTVMNLRVP
jgi:hypothetical protein